MRSQTLQTTEWLHRCYGAVMDRLVESERQELLDAARHVEQAELELYRTIRKLMVDQKAA